MPENLGFAQTDFFGAVIASIQALLCRKPKTDTAAAISAFSAPLLDADDATPVGHRGSLLTAENGEQAMWNS